MVFQKAEFDVNILSPTSSLPVLMDSVILSSMTRSFTLGKGRGWSSLWLHHNKLGGNLSGNNLYKESFALDLIDHFREHNFKRL